MVRVCAYNIRGLNKTVKKADLHSFLVDQNISLAGILETRVKENKASASFRAVHHSWSWDANYQFHSNGRIWVGWNPNIWNVFVEVKSAQFIHCKATLLSSQVVFLFTFIYASNDHEDRLKLWADLASLHTNNHPWALLGDFNTIKDLNENSGGKAIWTRDMQIFKDFLVNKGLDDVKYFGTYHTWWNKQSTHPITRKLDRVLGNHVWLSTQSNADALFTPWGLSDHSASILNIQDHARGKPKAFQFYNYWIDHPDFLNVVKEAWSTAIKGNPIFILTQKLNQVKKKLTALQRNESSITMQIKNSRDQLCLVQQKILGGCIDGSVFEEEKNLTSKLEALLLCEENIAHQRSRVQWLALGDQNTPYFHKKIAANWNTSKITSLVNANGHIITDGEAIKQEAVNHFQGFYNKELQSYPGIDYLHSCIKKKISTTKAQLLTIKATDKEILDILKSMKRNKSPGPDEFNVNFFLEAWDVVGRDFLNAVHHFLETGVLPHYANATVLALIPKCKNPTTMKDYRPISCCNTLYKCISKLIAQRLRSTLPDLVDKAQAAFIKGRNISDNILMAQEILKGYNRKRDGPRAAFKMDLNKAFDSCHWQFIIDVLILRGYPFPIVRWVHSCLTTARFSVKVNGELEGYFSSKRGIRQGCPLSPFLFVLVMDVLSEMLSNLTENSHFKWHQGMKKLKLNHLCFADDLLMFCRGETHSISLLMNTLEQFKTLSGLSANPQKSSCYLSQACVSLNSWILNTYGIEMGILPAKFLGVPLITKKLSKNNCQPLIARINSRLEAWTNHFLSFAGRLQLLKSVLQAICSYWTAHFLLPKGILYNLQQIFSRFLWNGNTPGRAKAKVAWSMVTLPITEGGLGIKDLCEWNKAHIIKHLLSIINPSTTSLWADWVKKTIIKNKSFWIIDKPNKCSWILRKVLDIRSEARQYITYIVGNGQNTSLWFDPWHNNTPLCSVWNDPIISHSGYGHQAKVSDILSSSDGLSNDLPIWWQFIQLSSTFNIDRHDEIRWSDTGLKRVKLSNIWEAIRHSSTYAPWTNSVWHKLLVPRFSFLHWLIMHGRVGTLSRLKRFGVVQQDFCYLCVNGIENVGHLFLECPYTQHVLRLVMHGRLQNFPIHWSAFKQDMDNFDKNSLIDTIRIFAFQTVCYAIWRERNGRFHNVEVNPPSHLAHTCANIIQCRLKSSKWFNTQCTSNLSLLEWSGI